MNKDTLKMLGKIFFATMLVWIWFGVFLPYCNHVTNTISMAVGTAFAIFVSSVVCIWAVKTTWQYRKSKPKQ